MGGPKRDQAEVEADAMVKWGGRFLLGAIVVCVIIIVVYSFLIITGPRM